MPKRHHDELPPFGKQLGRIMEHLGLLNVDVATGLGLYESDVSRMRGRLGWPRIGRLIELADFFSEVLGETLTIDQFVGREDFPWEVEQPARTKRPRGPYQGPVEEPVGQIDEEMAGDGRARRSPRRGSAAGA